MKFKISKIMPHAGVGILTVFILSTCDMGFANQGTLQFRVPSLPENLKFLEKSIYWKVSGSVVLPQIAKSGQLLPISKKLRSQGDYILAEPFMASGSYEDELSDQFLPAWGWTTGGDLNTATIGDGMAAKILLKLDSIHANWSGLNLDKLRESITSQDLGTDTFDCAPMVAAIINHELSVYDFPKPGMHPITIELHQGTWVDTRGKLVCKLSNTPEIFSTSISRDRASWVNPETGELLQIFIVPGLNSQNKAESFLHVKK